MKTNFKRRVIILLVLILIIVALTFVFNRISFDPNFLSGNTTSDVAGTATWGYSAETLVLSDEADYIEETIETQNGSYVVLQRSDLSKDTLVILSDLYNSDYAEAVDQVAQYYEDLGYNVEIHDYMTITMLSVAHKEHFDIFLLREEASS